MKYSVELNKLFELDRELDRKHLSIFSEEYVALTKKMSEIYHLLYQSDNFFIKEISYKYFHNRLHFKMHDFFEEGKIFTEADVNEFLAEIKSLELQEIKIVRSLNGATLKKSTDIYKLGDFEIYHFPTHKEYLQSLTKMDPTILWHGQKNDYLIGINVFAREADKAAEIADDLFYKFEMCYYFIKAMKDEHHEIGILNYSPSHSTVCFALSKKTGFRSSTSVGSFRLIDIDDEYFIDKEDGYDLMWQLISKKHVTELEDRIIRAIMWGGKSIIENDIADSFVQIAIALEILLTYKQKDQLISPSIVNQLSETAAIIIADSCDDRIKVERDIKELYTIRSNVVHLGARNIEMHDYYKFFFYVKDIIVKLLLIDKYKGIKSSSELHSLIKRIKYS